MNRDIIIVGGMTGWGKSLWAKTFSAHAQRFLLFDPTLTYPNVQYDDMEDGMTDLLDSLDGFGFLQEDQHKKTFRVGCSDPKEAHRLGAAAFMLGNNLFTAPKSWARTVKKSQQALQVSRFTL